MRRAHLKSRGFTLVELLVVIGIIGLLIAILIPTIIGARRSAEDTACAARLRDLVAATTIYLNTNRSYPVPPVFSGVGGPVPSALTTEVINQLGTVMKWDTVDYSMNCKQLPYPVCCPVRLGADLLDESQPAVFGEAYWNTGYCYSAGMLDVTQTTAVALVPDRYADIRGRHRGVLWSDVLTMLVVGGQSAGYGYWHWNGGRQTDAAFQTYTDCKSFRGNHRAWTDGSVEFLKRGTFNMDISMADMQAAYRVGSPAGVQVYLYY